MQNWAGIANGSPLHSRGLEPVSQVGVFEPVSESLVEAANPSKILGKGRRVSPSPARLAGHSSVHDGTHQRKVTGEQPSALVDVSPPETRAIQITGHHLVDRETVRESAAEKHGASGQVAAISSRPYVPGQAFGRGDAVSIEKDEIVALGFLDREIENGSFPDPLVPMPDMANRNRSGCGIALDGSARLRSTSVIRNNQLKMTQRLPSQTGQYEPEAVEVVIGRYHHC